MYILTLVIGSLLIEKFFVKFLFFRDRNGDCETVIFQNQSKSDKKAERRKKLQEENKWTEMENQKKLENTMNICCACNNSTTDKDICIKCKKTVHSICTNEDKSCFKCKPQIKK